MTDIKKQKKEICRKLEDLLRSTRAHSDLKRLEYIYHKDTKEEEVLVTYATGFKRKINVSGDSGMALINDVIKHNGY